MNTDPAGYDSEEDWATREECEAAAQADYEARVLSALEPATNESAEPVAWRYRFTDPSSGKQVWRTSPSLWNGQKPQEVRPLYDHPQPMTVEAAAQVADNDEIGIRTIGNYYGRLNLKREGGEDFWCIEDWDGLNWEPCDSNVAAALRALAAKGGQHE